MEPLKKDQCLFLAQSWLSEGVWRLPLPWAVTERWGLLKSAQLQSHQCRCGFVILVSLRWFGALGIGNAAENQCFDPFFSEVVAIALLSVLAGTVRVRSIFRAECSLLGPIVALLIHGQRSAR